MAKWKVGFRKNNGGIIRVIVEIIITLAGLYAGGTALTAMGTMMNGSTSPFYVGLGIIGWTVESDGHIISTTGSGILAVVGIFAIIAIIAKFVRVSKVG